MLYLPPTLLLHVLIQLIERKRETCSEKLFSLYFEYLKPFSAPVREGVQLQLKHILQTWHFKLSLLLAQERSMALHPGTVCRGFLGRQEQLLGPKASLRKQASKIIANFNTTAGTLAGSPVHVE